MQKPATEDWRRDATEIYRSYDIYFQSGGVEQAVFEPARGVPRLRSQVLLEKLNCVRPLGETGKAIDVGCGKGTFLSAFQKFRPAWSLFGHELSRANEAILASIPRFERLYVGPLADLPVGFDLITLVHALEHFDEPAHGLRDLAEKVAPDGTVVVEVPNAGLSPFDLVVADHASHFTAADLWRLSQRSGLAPLVVADDWMSKELSLVSVRGERTTNLAPPSAVQPRIASRLEWLRAVLNEAHVAANKATRFGIFGTSIAAMWLYGDLAEQVDFFVDEDPGRLGTLHGRPVVTPNQIPDQATVYLALLPVIAAAVGSRIHRRGIEIVLPPAEG